MASHNKEEEQPESPVQLPSTDNQSDPEDDATSEPDDEEVESWTSTNYNLKRSKKKPMREPLTAPWGLAISDADVARLKVGFKSRSMDDKWDLLVEDPDESGGVSVHIIRNWLKEDCYILHVTPKRPGTDGGAGGGGAVVSGITWEGNKNNLQCGAEQAKKEAVMLCRGWLKCEFEGLPQYPSSVFWDRKAYWKLGEPEVQPGSNADGSSAGDQGEAKEVDPRLKLHVMSLGSRYWNEGA